MLPATLHSYADTIAKPSGLFPEGPTVGLPVVEVTPFSTWNSASAYLLRTFQAEACGGDMGPWESDDRAFISAQGAWDSRLDNIPD